MFRRTLTEADSASAVLDRMLNRLTKIAAELRSSPPNKSGQRLAG